MLNWLKDFISAQIEKGSEVRLIKLWQGREFSPKKIKRQCLQPHKNFCIIA